MSGKHAPHPVTKQIGASSPTPSSALSVYITSPGVGAAPSPFPPLPTTAMDSGNGEKPSEEDYKRVILLLRTELGKARDELLRKRSLEGGGKQPGGMKPMPEQSHVASPSGLVPVDPREELAMQQARIAQLAGEVRELRTMNEGLRAQGESRDLELAKEKRNHSHAQQNLHALEAQLQDIEQRFQLQLKQQNMHTQQHGKAKRHEIENIGLEYEAKLANVIGEYQEKLAAKESELIQMMDLLAEKDSMLSTVLPQRATAGEGNSSPASKMQDPSSPASPSTTVDNDKKELLNSLESMKIMLSNSKTEEERLYNQLAQAKENEKKLLDNLTEMQQGDEALESKIQTLSARVLTLSEKLEHTTQLLQNEITAHKACKEALVQSENALRACQDAKRESEQTCLDLEEQIKLQADKENALTSRLENQATKLKAAEHKAAESERAHDLTAETLRLAQEQLNHFENKLKELEQQDRERRQSAYESTKKTVEKYATLLEGMEGKVDVLEEEGRSMRQDLVRLRAEADESASKLDNERAVRKEAEETVRILSNQLSVEKEASVAMVDEKVASLENEIEKERERRRRIEEDFKSLVEDMDELTKNDGDSESLAEERAARRHAEDTLRKVAMEMEALKKHHGSQLQAMMQKLQTAQQERGTNHDIETALMQSEQEVQALLAKRNEAQLALRLLVREVELLRAGPEGGGLESDESRTEEKFSWKKQARVLADEGMSEAWALLTDIKNELRKPTASLKSSSSPPRRAIPASPLRQSPAESLPSKPSQIKPEDAPQIILQQLHTSKSSKAAHQNAPTHVPATASPLPRAAPRGDDGSKRLRAFQEGMDALVRAGSDGQRFGNEFKSKPESDSLLGGLGLGLGTILKNDKGAFMKVGDGLLAVDGEHIRSENFPEILRKLQGPAGSQVSLTLARSKLQARNPHEEVENLQAASAYRFHVALVRAPFNTFASFATESGQQSSTNSIRERGPFMNSRADSQDESYEWDA